MGGEAEAAGDALTGAIIARTIDAEAGAPAKQGEARAECRNCGAALTGAYCASCGQAARIHRSLASLGHDILHGVFHFEGKFWRTIPELLFHPGRLTRRYIEGERVKFVSPMALFLFTVFVTFAVFSFTAGSGLEAPANISDSVITNWQSGNLSALEETNAQIEKLREQRAADDVTPEKRAEIDREIAEREAARDVMEALAAGDFARVGEIADAESQAEMAKVRKPRGQWSTDLGGPSLNRRLNEGLRAAQDNPGLLLYKLKTNTYKFSWALIPLSLPFMWLLFFWRRDIHLYDHAIFVTYSISFMMLLLVVLSIAASLGAGAAIWGTALAFIPPIHMYKQLRGAYGLSRFGAGVRLFVLLIATGMVLTIFAVLLLLIGVLA